MQDRNFRICLADPHASVRKCLRQLLEPEVDLTIVGEASNGPELLRVVANQHPDLAMTEISLAELDGLEAIRVLRQRDPSVKVLVFASHSDPEYVKAAFAAGARGFLDKGASIELIVPAIRCVLEGERYIPAHLTVDWPTESPGFDWAIQFTAKAH